MFKTIAIILILGVIYVAVQPKHNKDIVIENPVYSEIRMQGKVPTDRNGGVRELEMTILAKTIDSADCEKQGGIIAERFTQKAAGWTVVSKECLDNLPSRYERLFGNEPINSAYLSVTRAAPDERDLRMVMWGLTSDESRRFMCDVLVPLVKKKAAGAVTCVKPVGA